MKLINLLKTILLLVLVLTGIDNTLAQTTFIKHSAINRLNFALGFCKTFDNGFLATGQDDGDGVNGGCDFYVQKFDECGNVLWYRRIGQPLDVINFTEGGLAITEAANHDVIVVGIGIPRYFKNDPTIGFDGHIMRLDPNGNLLWVRSFGNRHIADLGDEAESVLELPNGNIAVAGFITPNAGIQSKPYLLMLDGAGNLIYDKTYSGPNGELDYPWPHGLKLDNAGNIIVSGSCVPAGLPWTNFFLKIDPANGNCMQSKLYSFASGFGFGYDRKHGFTKLANGDFAAVTNGISRYNSAKNTSVLYRIDNNGNLLWAQEYASVKYGNPNPNPVPGGTSHFQNDVSDESYSVIEANNGDLLTTGAVNNTQYLGVGYENGDTLLVTSFNYIALRRFSSTGNLKLAKLFGDGNSVCKARGVLQTSDRGFFLNGYTTGFGSGVNSPNYYDPLFIKTDSLGIIKNDCFSLRDSVVNLLLAPTVTSFVANTVDSCDYYYVPQPWNPIVYWPLVDTICYHCGNPPSFSISKDTVCSGIVFKIKNTTTGLTCDQNLLIRPSGTGASILDTTNIDTLTYKINVPGKYIIQLKSSCGIYKDSIYIAANPVINLTASPSAICPGNSATLTASNAITYTLIPNAITGSSFVVTPTITSTYSLVGTGYYGCASSNTATAIITVYNSPVATFTVNETCINTNIVLNNTSNIALPDFITQHSWAFGVGATPSVSILQNPPSLMYNSSGIKTITLTTISNHNCTASTTHTVMINPLPVPSFSASSVCQGLFTSFTDLSSTSTSTINAWKWDFMNFGATNSTSQTPTFMYPASGVFTANLQVKTVMGCSNKVSLPINVWGTPVADFVLTAACFGTANTFTSTSTTSVNANTGFINNYLFSFGDGVSSVLPFVAHTYTATSNATLNSVYNVSLSIISIHGCKDSIVLPVNVYALPQAAFSSDSVCLNTQNHLTSNAIGNGNTLTSFKWDLTNDNISDMSGSSNISYTFPQVGNNVVNFTVTTMPSVGIICSSYTTANVWVHVLPQPDFIFANTCINSQPNFFDASLSSIPLGSNTNYQWDYGDSQTGLGMTSTHTYSNATLYNVSLTVTSNKGCQASATHQIEVYPKPIMQIDAGSVCLGSVSSFTANQLPNSAIVTTWQWDVNQSIASFEANGEIGEFTYTSAGTHTLNLISTTNHNCKDTVTQSIYINYIPSPQFIANNVIGCSLPLCVTYTDNTSPIPLPGKITNWYWSFGDSIFESATTNKPQTHCYVNKSSTQLAYYTVTLTTTTDGGCVASTTQSNVVTLYPNPLADYSIIPDLGTVLEPIIYFNNQSLDYTKWSWDFGDGTKTDSTHVNISHAYPNNDANSYHSMLVVTNQYNCRDTAFVLVNIAPEFVFYIPNAFTPNEDKINDMFTGMGIGIDKYEMWIYDRWGSVVFHTDDIKKGWNGKMQDKLEFVEQDVYVWKVKLRDVLNKDHSYVGHVTLLR